MKNGVVDGHDKDTQMALNLWVKHDGQLQDSERVGQTHAGIKIKWTMWKLGNVVVQQ